VSYWLHPEAEAELADAAVYYAEHASLSVAEAFLAEFERVRDLLIETSFAARMANPVCGSTSSIVSRTRSSTSPTSRPGLRSTPLLISTVNLATGLRVCSGLQRVCRDSSADEQGCMSTSSDATTSARYWRNQLSRSERAAKPRSASMRVALQLLQPSTMHGGMLNPRS